MSNQMRISFSIVIVSLLCCASILAQTKGSTSTTIITAAAAADRVHITAPASIVHMRLEVYDSNGTKVWDSKVRGNVFDWLVQDGEAKRLTDGDYACVVTVKNVAGKLTKKVGLVGVGNESVTVKPAEDSELSELKLKSMGAIEEDSSWTILSEEQNQTTTVIAHDGTDGQIVRGRGAFSFRFGDFFSGRDKEQMRLTEAGDLGIGTSKPTFKLDVAGAIRAREGFVFNNGSTLNVNEKGSLSLTAADGNTTANLGGIGTQDRLAKWIDNSGTLGDSGVTELNGNIGIGIGSPAHKLHVFGKGLFQFSGSASLFIVDRTDGKIASLGAGGLSSTFAYDQSGIFKIESNARANIAQGFFGPLQGATTRFVIDGSGNVGVGTETPGFKLDVAGRIRLRQNTGAGGNTNTAGLWLFQNTPNSDRAFIGMVDDNNVGFFGNNGANWGLVMNTQNSNVAINVPSSSNPILALTVDVQSFQNQANALASHFFKVRDIGANGPPAFLVRGDGNVGIGTNSPVAKLDVEGFIRVGHFGNAGFVALCHNVLNIIGVCGSSLRYKNNVADFRFGLRLIRQLRPVSFNWKANEQPDFGLIAEEVAEVEPLLVTQNAAGEIEGVKYDRIGVVLINAVKEQQAQIEKQQREIDALKTLVCSMNPRGEICRRKE